MEIVKQVNSTETEKKEKNGCKQKCLDKSLDGGEEII